MTRNPAFDDAVRDQHARDRHRTERLLDALVVLPPKREARRMIIALMEQAREDGAAWPELAREMALRRGLADADIEEGQLEQLDLQRSHR